MTVIHQFGYAIQYQGIMNTTLKIQPYLPVKMLAFKRNYARNQKENFNWKTQWEKNSRLKEF